MWKEIGGYKYPYRINQDGIVQVKHDGKWRTLEQNCRHYGRAEVYLRQTNGLYRAVGVFRLLDKCFNDGYAEKNGLCVVPHDGDKGNTELNNIAYRTRLDMSRGSLGNRKPVVRYDQNGNSTAYKSCRDAAKASGIKPTTFSARLKNGTQDPRGYRFEVER